MSANDTEVIFETSREIGEEVEVSTRAKDFHSHQIDVDTELAHQMAQEELTETMLQIEEAPAGYPSDEILQTKLRRVLDWQKWCMSSLVVVAEGLQSMWDEDIWALQWMGTSSIFAAHDLMR